MSAATFSLWRFRPGGNCCLPTIPSLTVPSQGQAQNPQAASCSLSDAYFQCSRAFWCACFFFPFSQGAVYGILAAKLSDQPEDEPFSFQAHAILLPWVSRVGVSYFEY